MIDVAISFMDEAGHRAALDVLPASLLSCLPASCVDGRRAHHPQQRIGEIHGFLRLLPRLAAACRRRRPSAVSARGARWVKLAMGAHGNHGIEARRRTQHSHALVDLLARDGRGIREQHHHRFRRRAEPPAYLGVAVLHDGLERDTASARCGGRSIVSTP